MALAKQATPVTSIQRDQLMNSGLIFQKTGALCVNYPGDLHFGIVLLQGGQQRRRHQNVAQRPQFDD